MKTHIVWCDVAKGATRGDLESQADGLINYARKYYRANRSLDAPIPRDVSVFIPISRDGFACQYTVAWRENLIGQIERVAQIRMLCASD